MNVFNPVIIKLEKNNYRHWKVSLERALRTRDLAKFIDGTATPPSEPDCEDAATTEALLRKYNKDLSAYHMGDAQAMNMMESSLSSEHLAITANCKTALEMYSAITTYIERKGASSLWNSQRKLSELKFTLSHNVTSYFSELEQAIEAMRDAGSDVKDHTIIAKVLEDLPKSFALIKAQVNMKMSDNENLTLAQVKRYLLTAENEFMREDPDKFGAALAVRNYKPQKRSDKKCFHCNMNGHLKHECRKLQRLMNNRSYTNSNFNNNMNTFNNNANNQQNRSTNNNFSGNQQNNNFGQNQRYTNNSNTNAFNHNQRRPNYSNNYPQSNRNNNNRRFNNQNRNSNNNQNFPRNQANLVNHVEPNSETGIEENQRLDPFGDYARVTTTMRNNDWILDTGASYHLTSKIENFVKFEDLVDPIQLTIGDGSSIKAIGKGSVDVLAFDGKKNNIITLYDVLYVPQLDEFNLFSFAQVAKKGYCLHADDKETRIFHAKTNATVITGQLIGTQFELNIKTMRNKDIALSVTSNVPLSVWHKRLAHINVHKIIEMMKAGVLPKAKIDIDVNNFVCEACVKGKMARKAFKSAPKREFKVGELMHADLQGPMHVPSLGESLYALLIKDDASSFRSIFFLKFKSDTYNSLAAYIGYVQRVTGNHVKVLRSDNGGEFIDHRVKSLLRVKSIDHELTAPYTPEQNGKIERENRTVTELARTMLQESKLPTYLWPEAMQTAVFTLNFLPNKKTNISPYELWHGTKPNFSQLRQFGCVVFGHVPDVLRKKWEPKARKFCFVGYTTTDKNYRVFCPYTKNITILRDAKFVEHQKFSDELPKSDYEVLLEEASVEKEKEDYKETNKEVAKEVEANPTQEDAPNPDAFVLKESEETKEINDLNEPFNYPNILLQANITIKEPLTYEEATACREADLWLNAMKDEIASLNKNNTYVLVKLPEDKRTISCRWVFKIKRNLDGSIERYKARLVARGYSQKEGIDYNETFSPVARYDSIRALLSISAAYRMHLLQFDVKTAFLYGDLEEEIYMDQPPGFNDGTNKVMKLTKGLYGLKQAPRQWNAKINQFFSTQNFNRSYQDHCIFFKTKPFLTICVIYVDDGLVASTDLSELKQLTNSLSSTFEMKFHTPQIFVGMEIRQSPNRESISIKQTTYINELLKRFKMTDCKSMSTPGDSKVKLEASNEQPNTNIPYQEAVGALLYLSIISRPDITFQVCKASQFNKCYNDIHYSAVKRIFRYLKGTTDTGITYSPDPNNFNLIAYCDADYGGDLTGRKSTSGFVVTLGGSPISWASRLQRNVATSTTEAEYVAISVCAKDVIWYKRLLKELKMNIELPIPIYSDNQGAIKLSKNPMFHNRTKHIDMCYHFIRDYQEKGYLIVHYVPTKQQPADFLTKPLDTRNFEPCKVFLNITPVH